MSDSVLSCHNLTQVVHDGKQTRCILSQMTVSIAKGERVAIVGASGSGKSTLLHLLAGLDQPTQGRVDWGPHNIALMSANALGRLRNRYLGFVYQAHHLLPELTALENVSLPLLIGGTQKKVAYEKARDLLNHVALGDRCGARVYQLSGGERQRVGIARGLANSPKCLLADEPTGNLDAKTAQQVLAFLWALCARMETAVVLVTHHQAVAEQMDRCLLLGHA